MHFLCYFFNAARVPKKGLNSHMNIKYICSSGTSSVILEALKGGGSKLNIGLYYKRYKEFSSVKLLSKTASYFAWMKLPSNKKIQVCSRETDLSITGPIRGDQC